MIFTIIVWLYITLLTYSIGYAFHRLLSSFLGAKHSEINSFSLLCISGLLVIGFILSILCLFTPLDIASNSLLLLLAALPIIFDRKLFLQSLQFHIHEAKNSHWVIKLLFFLSLIIVAYLSYIPSTHHDDGLYYSTSIKWLQEFGTVKGLANLNPRIGFDSSWFILQANFGFPFLHLGLFNDLNGLVYLYVFMYSLSNIQQVFRGDHSFIRILKAFFFLPVFALHTSADSNFLFYNINQLSSTSSDLTVCILVWLVFIIFLDSSNSVTQKISEKELLVVFYSCSLICMKLSVLPIFVLTFFILLKTAFNGRWTKSIVILCSCIILVVPWLIRNILVTGYLIFPFAGIDLFSFDWKIPIENAQWHQNAIKVFAVDPTMDLSKPFTTPLYIWVPHWFTKLFFIQQFILLFVLASSLIYIIRILVCFFKMDYGFLKRNSYPIIFLSTSFFGIFFWLIKAPDFRFGYGFLWIYCAFTMALCLKKIMKERIRFLGSILMFFSFISILNYVDELKNIPVDFFKRPLPYPLPSEVKNELMNQTQVVHLVKHEDSWNEPLPVANEYEFYYIRPILRGKDIKEGFKAYSGKTN